MEGTAHSWLSDVGECMCICLSALPVHLARHLHMLQLGCIPTAHVSTTHNASSHYNMTTSTPHQLTYQWVCQPMGLSTDGSVNQWVCQPMGLSTDA